MHLTDRCGMGGFRLEGIKNLSGILAKLTTKCPYHKRVRKWRGRILGLGKLLGIRRREQGLIDAEHLSQLEGATLEFAESTKDLTRIEFLQRSSIGTSRYSLAPIMLEIIYTDPGPSSSKGCHAIEAVTTNRFLLAQDIFPHAAGARNRAKSNAESIA